MSDLRSRLGRLEGSVPEREPKTWILVNGEPMPADVRRDDVTVWVTSEQARDALTETIARLSA